MKTTCVIVPAKDEAVVIEDTLTALLATGIGAENIYLVDDGSKDSTGDIGRKLGVNVLRNEVNIGKAHSIARVVDVFELDTKYEFIGLMDADTCVRPDYFEAMHDGFTSHDVVVVCGRPIAPNYNYMTSYREFVHAVAHFIYKKGQDNMGVISVAPGCATIYRSTVWRSLEWSKDTLVEDVDVTLQIHKKRLGKIRYCPKALVYTQSPRTPRDYLKQLVRWNTGNWQAYRKHKLYAFRQAIDFECTLLYGESFIFYLTMFLAPVYGLYAQDYKLMLLPFAHMILTTVFAVIIAVVDKRPDILYHSWRFIAFRYIDAYAFLKGFWVAIVIRKAGGKWFTPARYSGK